jgi:hypothetical protein
MIDHDREIQALYSQLSEDELAVFEDYFQTQLQEAITIADAAAQDSATGAADVLVVEADLVEEIDLLAQGRNPAQQGVGIVPIPGGVMQVVPPQRNPFEATPEVDRSGGPGGTPQRRRWLLAGALLTMGLLLAFLSVRSAPTLPGDPPVATDAQPTASGPPGAAADVAGGGDPDAPEIERIGPEATSAPLVDAQVRRAKAGYPSSLEIVLAGEETPPPTRSVRSALVYRVVPSTGQLGGQWTPDIQAGTAAWLSGSYTNSVFCLPPDAADMLAAVPVGTPVLMRPATGDVRQYEIVRVQTVGRQQTEVLSQRKAGMTLLACNTPGNERVVAEAVYLPPISRERPPIAAVGNELPGYVGVNVSAISTQPVANSQVVRLDVTATLRNLSAGELRWTDLTDRLLIGGQAAQPARRVEWAPLMPDEERTDVYSYFVPAGTVETVWQVLAPTGESVDLQVVVPAVGE